jgi:outer membrane biosynthesis protein TonB
MPPKIDKVGYLRRAHISATDDFLELLKDVYDRDKTGELTDKLKSAIEAKAGNKKLPSKDFDTITNAFLQFNNDDKRRLLSGIGVQGVNITKDANHKFKFDAVLKEVEPADAAKTIQTFYKNKKESAEKKMTETPTPPKTTTTQVQPESPPPKPSKGAPKPTAQNAEAQEVEAEEHRKKEEKKIAVQERRVIDIPKAFKLIDKTNIGKQSNRLRAHDIHNTIKNTMNTEVKPVATVAKMDELQAKRDAHFKFSYRKLKFNRPSDVSQKSKKMLF